MQQHARRTVSRPCSGICVHLTWGGQTGRRGTDWGLSTVCPLRSLSSLPPITRGLGSGLDSGWRLVMLIGRARSLRLLSSAGRRPAGLLDKCSQRRVHTFPHAEKQKAPARAENSSGGDCRAWGWIRHCWFERRGTRSRSLTRPQPHAMCCLKSNYCRIEPQGQWTADTDMRTLQEEVKMPRRQKIM